MAEAEATTRRRDAARREGRVAVSPLLVGAGALLGAALGGWATAATARLRLVGLFDAVARTAAAPTGEAPIDPVAAARALPATLLALVIAALLGALAGALVVGAVQTRGYVGAGGFARRREPAEGRAVSWLFALALVAVALTAARDLGFALARARVPADALGLVAGALVGLLPRAIALLFLAGVVELLGRRRSLDAYARTLRLPSDDRADPRLAAERRRRQR